MGASRTCRWLKQRLKTRRGWNRRQAYRQTLSPKLVTALRQGYGVEQAKHDISAGLTVAILAIPLSMAIAIGSGATPGQGLITSVVAGILISALGGTRFQIGGPAAAFIVIVATLSAKHGYDGLATATFLAGFILLAAGFLKLGTYTSTSPAPSSSASPPALAC